MTAREKFQAGQRVRMTKAALDQHMDGVYVKRSTGVVKGFPRREHHSVAGMLVRVLRDGDKHPKNYHMNFWELEQ